MLWAVFFLAIKTKRRVSLQDRVYRYHKENGGSLHGYYERVRWLLARNETGKSHQMDRRFKKLLRESLDHGSLVHIYFKELGYVKYTTDELFGVVDLIGEPKYL